jgi:Mn-dependent DtxR family transcriptional regulator
MIHDINREVARLMDIESPVTTSWVSKKLNVNWGTANEALAELEREGLIRKNLSFGKDFWWVKLK